jgi:hypothetical protein
MVQTQLSATGMIISRFISIRTRRRLGGSVRLQSPTEISTGFQTKLRFYFPQRGYRCRENPVVIGHPCCLFEGPDLFLSGRELFHGFL